MKVINTEVKEVEKLANKIAKSLIGGEVLALIGSLGSGKTTFTKHLGKALGVKEVITSPTFTIMQEFVTKRKVQETNKPIYLYHLDLYRSKNFAEIDSLGLSQIWQHPQTITVIEWADKIKSQLPPRSIAINFKDNNVIK